VARALNVVRQPEVAAPKASARPGEKPWWDGDYTVAHKIRDRELPFPSPVLELVADLIRQKNHMAVWQHYVLLEDMAFPRWRTDGITLIRIFLRGTCECGTRSDHHCGRCGEKYILHDILQVGSIPVLRSALHDLSPALSTHDR
jgi:hypothetical protein